jgi:hypothetical protein
VRLIEHSTHSVAHKPVAPFAHHLLAYTPRTGNSRVRHSTGATQHNTGPQRQSLRQTTLPRSLFQRDSFFPTRDQLSLGPPHALLRSFSSLRRIGWLFIHQTSVNGL